MCLVISSLAAVFSTLLWYVSEPARKLKVSLLCWLFWGASIMWFVDLIFEYAQEGAAVFEPGAADLMNDAFLGISVVTAALVIWIAVMLAKDPGNVIRSILKKDLAPGK